jgi:hypothetical protein
MIRKALVRGLLLASVGLAATVAIGCAAQPAGEAEGAGAGTLNLPLTVTAGGHTYRFSRFQVLVYPEYVWLTTSGDPSETMLTAQLPSGLHQAQLYDWALERDDGAGNYLPVAAELISMSSVSFEILNGSTSTIAFQFETEGQFVTLGSGALQIVGEVTERPGSCAPLGNDCGEGSWCPPAELTGAPLACRLAGSVEPGETCNAPGECVANNSCVDFGAGPVCAVLCSAEDFEMPCAAGGTCVAAGVEYGVCTPVIASEP